MNDEIKELKNKITAAEGKQDRSDRDDRDIARWSLEIRQLKLENEILKLENEILDLKKDLEAEKKNDPDYARELRNDIREKGKELTVMREWHVKLLAKSGEVHAPVEEMKELALNGQESHIDKVIKVVTNRYKGSGTSHFIPSTYSSYWNGFHFVIDGKSILETHRPPNPNNSYGHRHVTLTSEALGKLYSKFYIPDGSVKVSDLLPEDFELAQKINEVAVEFYETEADRKLASRDFLKNLSPDGAEFQQSTFGLGVFKQTSTDHTLSIYVKALGHQIPISIIEFKVEMGVAGDPIMEDIAYHATHSLNKVILEKMRVPCLLITISGPVVVIYCGAWTGEVFHYDYLASIVTHPSCHEGYFTAQALFWRNIKDGLRDVAEEVKVINDKLQLGFPYLRTFKEGQVTVNFKYRTQVDQKDRVFTADEEGGQGRKLIIKFCQTYSNEVHQLLAEKSLAPRLYGIEKVAGGWLMVVMEEIQDAVPWSRESHAEVEALKDQLQQVLATLSPKEGQQYVHGDLRPPNVLVKDNKQIYIIDFEWAGKVDQARFPGIINSKVFSKVDGKAGGLITQKMDRSMLKFLLTGSY